MPASHAIQGSPLRLGEGCMSFAPVPSIAIHATSQLEATCSAERKRLGMFRPSVEGESAQSAPNGEVTQDICHRPRLRKEDDMKTAANEKTGT